MRCGRRGFTLLEVMIAIVIICGGFYAVTRLVLDAGRLTTSTQQTSLALSGARLMIETVRSTPFADIKTNWHEYNYDVPGLRPLASDADGKPGKVLVDDSDPKKLVITVSVHWDQDGLPRRLELQTVVANRYPPKTG